jgi:hypothetical protein
LAEAGFELLSRCGQVSAAQIEPNGDEQRHRKLVYFARRLPTSLADEPLNGGDY